LTRQVPPRLGWDSSYVDVRFHAYASRKRTGGKPPILVIRRRRPARLELAESGRSALEGACWKNGQRLTRSNPVIPSRTRIRWKLSGGNVGERAQYHGWALSSPGFGKLDLGEAWEAGDSK